MKMTCRFFACFFLFVVFGGCFFLFCFWNAHKCVWDVRDLCLIVTERCQESHKTMQGCGVSNIKYGVRNAIDRCKECHKTLSEMCKISCQESKYKCTRTAKILFGMLYNKYRVKKVKECSYKCLKAVSVVSYTYKTLNGKYNTVSALFAILNLNVVHPACSESLLKVL